MASKEKQLARELAASEGRSYQDALRIVRDAWKKKAEPKPGKEKP